MTLRRSKDSVQCWIMVDDSALRMILFYLFSFSELLGGALMSIEMNENHENPDSDIKIILLFMYLLCDPIKF